MRKRHQATTSVHQHAGTFGLASCISFFPAKVLGCFGDAGGVLVNDKNLYHQIYQLHDHGRDIDGEVRRWGRNSRLDNLQAAILSHKLKTYDQVIERRRAVAQMYEDQLGELDELQLPPPPSDISKHFDVYQNYELRAQSRHELKAFLAKNGIGTIIQWAGTPVHQFKELGFESNLAKTDRFFEECLMLPMNMGINDNEVKFVIDKVNEFYN